MATRFRIPTDAIQSSTGTPLSGGKLYFYSTGTTSALDTYSNDGLTIANSNPITLDSAGRHGDIFLKSEDYKVVLKTSAGVTLKTVDPVHGGSSLEDITLTSLDVDKVTKPSSNPTVTASAVAGTLNGSYYYAVSYVTADGETDVTLPTSVVTVASKKIDLTNIPVSSDPLVTARRIYRTAAAAADSTDLQLVTTINDNTTTTYTDNIADGSLGAYAQWINTTAGEINYGGQRLIAMGSQSTFLGINSGTSNTGYSNTGFGSAILPSNTYGRRNTGVGLYALFSNTSGSNNTGVGVHALNYQTTANGNSALGYAALINNVTGNFNSAIGAQALQSGTNVEGAVAVGYQSQLSCTTAAYNVSVGFESLWSNVSANANTAIGYRALKAATAANNTAVGEEAGKNVTTGTGGTFIGAAVTGSTTGNNNTVIGYNAGVGLGTGAGSTMIGALTGVQGSNTSGAVYIGYYAGFWETANDSFYVDNQLRTNLAVQKTDSLMWGTFNSTASSQTLTINAATTVTYALTVNSSIASTSTVKTGVYTVATLPAAGTKGRRAFVSDANATTFASTVAGGGSNNVPVYDDGTNWKIG